MNALKRDEVGEKGEFGDIPQQNKDVCHTAFHDNKCGRHVHHGYVRNMKVFLRAACALFISELMTKGGRHVFCVIVKYHHIYFKVFMVSKVQ